MPTDLERRAKRFSRDDSPVECRATTRTDSFRMGFRPAACKARRSAEIPPSSRRSGRCRPEPRVPELGAEFLVERFGLRPRGCPGKGGTPPLAAVPEQGELGHGEHLPADLEDASLRLSSGARNIRSPAIFFASQAASSGVSDTETPSRTRSPSPISETEFTAYRNRGAGDPLNDRNHQAVTARSPRDAARRAVPRTGSDPVRPQKIRDSDHRLELVDVHPAHHRKSVHAEPAMVASTWSMGWSAWAWGNFRPLTRSPSRS